MGKGGLKELILEVLHQGLGRNLIYATRPLKPQVFSQKTTNYFAVSKRVMIRWGCV